MSDDKLTALLAENVMGWKVFPARYIVSGRSWIPGWRFQPLKEVADAFRLLDKAAAESLRLTRDRHNVFVAEVQIGTRCGVACGKQQARAITFAVARALGIDAELFG